MGNCQAIDAATLVIQHPNGKVDNLYWPVPACEIMKINPGHYVALLITTTICHPTTTTTSTKAENTTTTTTTKGKNTTTTTTTTKTSNSNSHKHSNHSSTSSSTSGSRNSVRITRVKLLRPTDTLALGHVYRLISTQEVMKGLVAKKQAKMRKNGIELADSEALKEAEKLARSHLDKKTQQVSKQRHRSRTTTTTTTTTTKSPNGGTAKARTWQPSLHSISEAGS